MTREIAPRDGLLLEACPRIEWRPDGTGKRLTDVRTGRYLVPDRLDTERLFYLLQLRNPDGTVFAEASIRLAGMGGPRPEPYPIEYYGIALINGRDADQAEPDERAEAVNLLFEMLPHFAPVPAERAIMLKDLTPKRDQ